MNASFSVIIPAFNAPEHIRTCIESVKSNDVQRIDYEIIVVDGGLTDSALAMVRELDVKIAGCKAVCRKTIGALRNSGAREAGGAVFAFLDADMLVPDNWLSKAHEYFSSGFTGALSFIHTVPVSAGWIGKTWSSHSHLRLDKKAKVDFLPGGNIFINRAVFEEINGFNEKLKTGEDKDLTLRIYEAGYRVTSAPDITVIHLGYEKSLWHFMKKEFWRQGNTVELARQHGVTFRTLRNPALSAWHLIFLFAVVFSFFLPERHVTLLLISLWFLPSLAIALIKTKTGSPAGFYLAFFFLTFLRWNVSGFSLVRQILKGGDE